MRNYLIISFIVASFLISGSAKGEQLAWPPPPDQARLEYVGQIKCNELKSGSGLFGTLKRFVGGRSEKDQLSLPFDLVAQGSKLFLICQNIPALIIVNREDGSFVKVSDKKHPFSYPISLCKAGDGKLFITDSENGSVYKYSDGKVKLFISEGLGRPTGIAALPGLSLLYVVDTKSHDVKVFDYDGNLVDKIGGDSDSTGFHYPTFAAIINNEQLLINDALNYRIKRFKSDGSFISAFGSEGDGPGAFSRPKGIAVDSDSNIYVVDNLFDNIQIFDQTGRILLVVGSRGHQAGQFWSPAGIDISNDTIFIADTFNDRIQIMHYLGEKP